MTLPNTVCTIAITLIMASVVAISIRIAKVDVDEIVPSLAVAAITLAGVAIISRHRLIPSLIVLVITIISFGWSILLIYDGGIDRRGFVDPFEVAALWFIQYGSGVAALALGVLLWLTRADHINRN